MHIVNICLSIATLGAYHFWGKAKSAVIYSVKLHSLLTGLPITVPERALSRISQSDAGFRHPIFFIERRPYVFGTPQMARPVLQALAGLVLVLYVPIAIVNARRYR